MRIILSPAKQMVRDIDNFLPLGQPVFRQETKKILRALKAFSPAERRRLWKCSAKIAEGAEEMLETFSLNGLLTPAIISYKGIAFQYMAPHIFTNDEFTYVQENLRILSGLYGVVKPLDGVSPYRLEMQMRLPVCGCENLYDFWSDKIYWEILDQSHVIINLASQEYAKCVEPYLSNTDTYINCIFGEIEKGKLVQKGVYAKMARGKMVRYMASNHIEDPREMQKFHELGYLFDPTRSDKQNYVYVRKQTKTYLKY